MAYGRPPSAFSDSDLNGLVDGHLESGRQAELVQRLKAHSAERARVAAWREQNELLKASFSEVVNETVPLSLSLTPPPRLKCVTSNSFAPAITPLPQRSFKRSRRSLIGFGAVVGCIGITGCWLFAEHAAPIDLPPLVLAATGGADGMLVTPSFETPTKVGLKSEAAPGKPPRGGRALPTSAIPDLTEAGFSFTEATVERTNPTALVFFYEDAAGDRLVLSVAKISGEGRIEAALATPSDHSITWRRHGMVYTLGGPLDPRLLNAVATAVQAGDRATDDPN